MLNVEWFTGCLLISTSFLVFLGEVVAKPVQSPLPDGPLVVDPLFCLSKYVAFDVAGADAANFLRCHKRARFQYLEVLHDRCQRHGQGLSQLTHGGGALYESLHDRPAGRVRQGLEDPVQIYGLVNHFLKYFAPGPQ
jgi:hypothetical protein